MIETRNLAFAYKGGAAMQFADVRVEQGETLLLRGASGSGKSTWLALVAGLLTPSEGEVVVAGQSLTALEGAGLDRWRGQHIGFLPQKLCLSESLSVGDNLALVYFARAMKVDRGAIANALNRLGLAPLAHRKPSQLSGGQAQRVALARALLLGPKLLLADEPTASLDDAACQRALAELKEGANSAGATLVVATHDARVVVALPEAQLFAMPHPEGEPA